MIELLLNEHNRSVRDFILERLRYIDTLNCAVAYFADSAIECPCLANEKHESKHRQPTHKGHESGMHAISSNHRNDDGPRYSAAHSLLRKVASILIRDTKSADI